MSLPSAFYSLPASVLLLALTFAAYHLVLAPYFNPLRRIAGPPQKGWFGTYLQALLDPARSPKVHEIFVRRYGRTIRIRGVGPWDVRLLSLDPVTITHVLKHSQIYEKPWQSQRLITSLIGCGMLGAEGAVHKRQRRVATPAFSIQNMRALVPLVYAKGTALRERWSAMFEDASCELEGAFSEDGMCKIDVARWVSRATFDVIGIAGFDYNFNAIQDETNELFCAYKDMFEVAISQGGFIRTVLMVYLPFLTRILVGDGFPSLACQSLILESLQPDEISRTVRRCQEVIRRVGGHLIQEKKRKVEEGQRSGKPYEAKDLLSLLLKSNTAPDLPPDQRISDEDILHNINTFMFAGSDTSSLALTWILLLLAQNPTIQERLRDELQAIAPPSDNLSEEEIQSLYGTLADLPYLSNVTRESMRLIPPVHSSLRAATQDDVLPTSSPVHKPDGTVDEGARSVLVPKGSFIHVPIEAFNLDKSIWGDAAWEFNPDRWDALPDAVNELPGLFAHTLTFSAGPRSCIGMRFSLIEIKTFLYILLTSFEFSECPGTRIIKANVVLTRPYVAGRFKEGSQCPLMVKPITRKL
ncbi:hypothetical protein HGRIS_002196 [Hohenbuehelia grisea]|uniref:Cytochrome P450 n=1 Tax=Hohenbuehelia grisea TaxID=104357 RepID=A0ABR3JKW6_9AGAR